MSELHRQSLPYDLAHLSSIVVHQAPDLLCARITLATCEEGDLSTAAFEVREALDPVVAATDIVLIPVVPTSERFADFMPSGRQIFSLFGISWYERGLPSWLQPMTRAPTNMPR